MCPFFIFLFFIFSDMSCRSRLATLNEKLTALERRIEYIEARVCFKSITRLYRTFLF
uniref:Uncharacterized protein n=1 Tax=Cyprinus carpio TaxID=7962 RepID=A0A8C1NRJ3_CYPCA